MCVRVRVCGYYHHNSLFFIVTLSFVLIPSHFKDALKKIAATSVAAAAIAPLPLELPSPRRGKGRGHGAERGRSVSPAKGKIVGDGKHSPREHEDATAAVTRPVEIVSDSVARKAAGVITSGPTSPSRSTIGDIVHQYGTVLLGRIEKLMIYRNWSKVRPMLIQPGNAEEAVSSGSILSAGSTMIPPLVSTGSVSLRVGPASPAHVSGGSPRSMNVSGGSPGGDITGRSVVPPGAGEGRGHTVTISSPRSRFKGGLELDKYKLRRVKPDKL